MNALEAEQLANEITREASWYLENIHVHQEPHWGENTFVVEARIVDTIFPVAYSSRQEWLLEHQEQLKYQVWEQQKGEVCAARPS